MRDGYRDGYVARWHDEEYEVSPDGDEIRLYSTEQRDGFDEIRPGRYRRVVPAGEVSGFAYVRTMCTWQNEPFIILGEHDNWVRVEYTGGKAPIAASLRLEEFDYGVYQGWAPIDEITEVREYRV
jgi:hypothetical protein